MLKKIGEYLLGAFIGSCLFWSVVAGYNALATQSALFSPTSGTVSGLNLTNNYNSAIDSLNTCNSGTVAPTNQLSGSPSKGNCWLDTSTAGYAKIKIYDGTSWLITGIMDTTNHVYFQPAAGGNLSAVTITAASTTDLCGSTAVQGAFVLINGSTTINSFGNTCPAGTFKYIVNAGSWTITYNATSMQLNGAVNLTPNGGDMITMATDGLGNWFQEGFNTRAGVTCGPGATSGSFQVLAGVVVHC